MVCNPQREVIFFSNIIALSIFIFMIMKVLFCQSASIIHFFSNDFFNRIFI